ncbi:MAG: hydrogenase maturation protease [Bacteroidetes bacterium]|nr:hydrogenase maturation protease [Bacteroidota bacterium]MBL6962947.1 hydrogenase maturation protease [Bacteroidota bacterium]
MEQKNILIVGMGSDFHTDEGIGVKMVSKLSADPYFQKLSFKTESLFSLVTLDSIKGYKTVVFIDGMNQNMNPPGHISIHSLFDFQETLHLKNIHEMNFRDCFTFWKKLEYQIPENVFVISIEVDDFLSFGSKLSPKLSKSFDENLNQVKSWIHHLSISDKCMLIPA